MSNYNFNNYITLINKDNKTKTCKVGFSWTSLFFIYLVPLFRLDFKNFTLQILLYSACIVIVPLSPILVTIVYIGIAIYYNNLYIKDLVNKGYMPYSDKDALLLDKVLNNKVVNLDLNKTSDDKLDTIPKNSTSQVYDDLIKRKDDLIKSLENVDYKVEENIKEFKVVLGKLLEVSPNDDELFDLLAEITIKEDYLIALYKVQVCVDMLNDSRNLSTFMFNHYLTELKDIYLPKLKESEQRNLNICRTPLYEIDQYVKEKLVQYERRLKREEKEYRDKRNYVVFDLETTGLSPINNEITEIGAVKVIDGKISDTFEMLVKPNQKISKKITDITGITNEMVKKFGVSLEQFEKDAMDSCKKNYPARIRDDYFPSEENHPKVVMVTNDQFLNGAAVLFYPETISELLEIFPEGFILIPASIHELIAYSLSSRKDYEEIDKTIARCNTKYCDNETSVLSTHAYVYDPEVNRLETSEEYCRRKDISYDPKTYEREKIKCENEVDEEEW